LPIGRHDEAVAFCEEARRSHGNWGPAFRILAALRASGADRKSRRGPGAYREREPGASVAYLRRQLPYRNAEQAERLWKGLRKAGLPE
jgi:hypothetical protein